MGEVVLGRMQTSISKPHLEKVDGVFFRQLEEALFASSGSHEGVVTILMYARRTTQKDINNPGGFWNALTKTS